MPNDGTDLCVESATSLGWADMIKDMSGRVGQGDFKLDSISAFRTKKNA